MQAKIVDLANVISKHSVNISDYLPKVLHFMMRMMLVNFMIDAAKVCFSILLCLLQKRSKTLLKTYVCQRNPNLQVLTEIQGL